MKRNIAMKIILMFALCFPLFLSFSYATLAPDFRYTYMFSGASNNSISSYGGYSTSSFRTALANYEADPSSLNSIMDDLINNNYVSSYFIYSNGTYKYLYMSDNPSIDFAITDYSSYARLHCIKTIPSTGNVYYITTENNSSLIKKTMPNQVGFHGTGSFYKNLLYSSSNIYLVSSSGGEYGDLTWDGVSYFYESTPSGPSYIPSNSEIAEKVQAFYNSDLYKNQKDFKDFFVLYNYKNGYFSFIGHNLENKLAQAIYSADYELNEFGVRYWQFYVQGTNPLTYLDKYWLYSTTLDSYSISYDGTDSIMSLTGLRFDAQYCTIVYSTTDYHCVEYVPNVGSLEQMPNTTIPGNQYTYDENIDPTTSLYDPISNFVPTNPVDTALGRIDTTSISTFLTDNVISFTELTWVFNSVSTLFNIFSSFLILICVLLLISKIIGG